jgi:hypothetical protein
MKPASQALKEATVLVKASEWLRIVKERDDYAREVELLRRENASLRVEFGALFPNRVSGTP